MLIPRPETEQVVEVALREIAHLGATGPVIVDAGTGSGAIALSLATELARSNPEGRVWAVDCSPDALAVARSNLERVRRRDDGPMLPVTMVQGSWLSALPAAMEGRITLVVSNPPYIEPTQWTGLQAEVRHEPAGALLAADGTDGTPGLGDVEAVLRQAWGWLSRPGAAVIEVAPDQAPAAVGMAAVHRLPRCPRRPRPGRSFPGPRGPGPMTGPPLVRAGAAALGDALNDGHVIAVPGVGGYQLAARHGAPGVTALLALAAAGGDDAVPFVAIGRIAQAGDVTSDWSEVIRRVAIRFWPGPLVLIVGEADGSVRITMPTGRALRVLCRRKGPLVMARRAWRRRPTTDRSRTGAVSLRRHRGGPCGGRGDVRGSRAERARLPGDPTRRVRGWCLAADLYRGGADRWRAPSVDVEIVTA